MCTVGLDRNIVLYDLKNKYLIKVISAAHETGIRKLASIEAQGGFLVTCAYETCVKVWQPGNLYGE